jgi:adenine-specific DNA-methyltransferase
VESGSIAWVLREIEEAEAPCVAAGSAAQLELVEQEPAGAEIGNLAGEDPAFLSSQLVTYLGNKRALLKPIAAAVEEVQRRVGRNRLRVLDAFSGSGAVSRLLKRYASELVVNDIEDYARAVSLCYLTNRSEVDRAELDAAVLRLNARVESADRPSGFLRRLYAPADEDAIELGERVFYTPENAARLDAYRQLLDEEPKALRRLLLAPLLSAASVHANTAGVFKGFYKDRSTGIGRFGGSGADALERIKGTIELQAPVLSRFEGESDVRQLDANRLVREIGDLDIAYLDPPYNQHPYGSNYFMLNLIVNYEEPAEVSRVSGIPRDWRRSDYNVRAKALPRLRELVTEVDARFVILSFNDEGFISPHEMLAMLEEVGEVSERRESYTTFRGCRNLANRSSRVTEHVYLIEKS